MFVELTGLSKLDSLKECLDAPFSLKQSFLEKIARETQHAEQGKKAAIKAKMNALADHDIMHALHHAAKAGVQIDLIVRGICCLKPSDNLRIRSVLGRFLEHSRVYYFQNDQQPELYLSSADLMTRNLSQRIEIAFPIRSPELRKRILHEAFELYLADNAQSFELQEDGSYQRPELKSIRNLAQEQLVDELT